MRKAGQRALTLVVNSDARAINTDDLSGLPDELLKELSVSQADALDHQITEVFQALGGSADLDQILIGLYRKFQVVQKRRFLQNKLWRMVRKGQMRKPKGERGHFHLEKPRQQHKGRRK